MAGIAAELRKAACLFRLYAALDTLVRMSAASHVALVASLAYRERLAGLPQEFEASLVVEPDNRYFRHAVAVQTAAGKIGYIAREGARSRYDAIVAASTGAPPSCRVRRAGIDRTSQGAIEFYLDLSAFPIAE